MANKDVVSSPHIPEKGPTGSGKRQFDVAAANVLERRIMQARDAGAVNIAIDCDFLLELLHASKEAMTKANYKSRREI